MSSSAYHPSRAPDHRHGHKRPFPDDTSNREQPAQPVEKEKPNFKPSGLLAKESNSVQGVQLKYTEPEDAAPPPTEAEYYLYVLKNEEQATKPVDLTTKSNYLIGRDAKLVDILTADPSCSKQHAVIQYRWLVVDGVRTATPYLIDLRSQNQTYLNGERIPSSRFIELKNEDVLKFGDDDTDYVFIQG